MHIEEDKLCSHFDKLATELRELAEEYVTYPPEGLLHFMSPFCQDRSHHPVMSLSIPEYDQRTLKKEMGLKKKLSL